MKGESDVPKMPWTVRVPMLELYALAAICLGVTPIVRLSLFPGLVFLGIGLGLQHGREWVAELFAAWVVICGILGSVLSFILQRWTLGCIALALSLPALLVCLPSAGRWFSAVGAIRSTKKPLPVCLGVVARILAWVVSVPIAFAVLIALVEFPGLTTASRRVRYESKDALLLNEAEQVIKTFDFKQDGSNYTAIVLKPIGVLASGPAVYVADATGRIVARCSDYGEDMQFHERWAFSWKDFRKDDSKTEDAK